MTNIRVAQRNYGYIYIYDILTIITRTFALALAQCFELSFSTDCYCKIIDRLPV